MPRRALFLIVLFALCAARAHAQGTGGLLPDPISTADLIEWFEDLDATKDQRASILALHDAYLVKCKNLREGRIQALLDLEKVAHPTNPIGILGDERDLQRFVRELESINAEIERLDDQFMAEVANALSDEAGCERAMEARQGARLLSDPIAQWWLSPFRYPEIGELAAAAKVTDEETELIDPLVREYERALAGELKRLINMAHEHLLEYRRALREAGMNYDPKHERGGARQEEQLAIWMSRNEKPAAQGTRIAQLRAEYIRKAATALPVDAGHRYRLAFNSGGGAYMHHDGAQHRLDRQFDMLLARDDMSPGDTARIVEMRDEYHRRWARLHDEMMNAKVETYGGATWFSNADAATRQDTHLRWTDEWVARCQALADETHAAIGGVIGSDLAAEMTAAYDRWLEERRAQNRVNEPNEILMRSPARRGMDQLQFLPPQITRADFDMYAAALDLSEDQRQSAQNLLNEYLDALRDLAANALDGLYRSTAWTENPETGVLEPPSFSEYQRVEANRERMRQAMDALHERLLRDLGSLVESEAADRLAIIEFHREARSLAEYQSSLVADWAGYTEVQANIIDAILAASLPEASRQRALAIAVEYAAELRSRWQAHLSAQQRQLLENERAMIDLAPYNARKATVEEILHSEPARRTRAFMDTVLAARDEVIDLNRAVLAEIEAALPEHQANTLRLSYLREAYPALFVDPTFDEMLIPRAMALAGITDEQKLELAVIEWDHAQGYTDLSMQMCEILRQSPEQGMWGSSNTLEVFNDRKTRQEQVDRLRFYRNELNHRARLKVQDILTPEQWAVLTSESVTVPEAR